MDGWTKHGMAWHGIGVLVALHQRHNLGAFTTGISSWIYLRMNMINTASHANRVRNNASIMVG
jgi:hypothetical protein